MGAVSQIEAAYREYMRLDVELDKASIEVDEIEERLNAINPPVYKFGFDEGGYDVRSDDDGNGYIVCSTRSDNVAKLEEIIAPPNDDRIDDERRANAKATLAKIEKYLANETKNMRKAALRLLGGNVERLMTRKPSSVKTC